MLKNLPIILFPHSHFIPYHSFRCYLLLSKILIQYSCNNTVNNVYSVTLQKYKYSLLMHFVGSPYNCLKVEKIPAQQLQKKVEVKEWPDNQ